MGNYKRKLTPKVGSVTLAAINEVVVLEVLENGHIKAVFVDDHNLVLTQNKVLELLKTQEEYKRMVHVFIVQCKELVPDLAMTATKPIDNIGDKK